MSRNYYCYYCYFRIHSSRNRIHNYIHNLHYIYYYNNTYD